MKREKSRLGRHRTEARNQELFSCLFLIILTFLREAIGHGQTTNQNKLKASSSAPHRGTGLAHHCTAVLQTDQAGYKLDDPEEKVYGGGTQPCTRATGQ